MTLGAYVCLRYPIRSRRTWSILSGSACLVALALIVPELIQRPTLTFHSALPLRGGAMQEYRTNLKEALILGQQWADSYGVHWSIMVGGILAAIFSIAPHQRRTIGVMGGVTVTLLLGAFVFIYPGYTAVLVRRIWVLLIIFLTGLISLAVCHLMQFIRHAHRMAAPRPQQQRRLPDHWEVWVRNLALLLLIFPARCAESLSGLVPTVGGPVLQYAVLETAQPGAPRRTLKHIGVSGYSKVN